MAKKQKAATSTKKKAKKAKKADSKKKDTSVKEVKKTNPKTPKSRLVARTWEKKASDSAGLPAGAPPASEVLKEYETETHRIYKLKDHTKIVIAK